MRSNVSLIEKRPHQKHSSAEEEMEDGKGGVDGGGRRRRNSFDLRFIIPSCDTKKRFHLLQLVIKTGQRNRERSKARMKSSHPSIHPSSLSPPPLPPLPFTSLILLFFSPVLHLGALHCGFFMDDAQRRFSRSTGRRSTSRPRDAPVIETMI